MSVLFLANVGNRDLCVDGQPLPVQAVRARGEALLEQWRREGADALFPRLAAPLIEASLRYILDREPRVRVALFATDQPETVEERHRARDTIHVAGLLKEYLRRRYPNRVEDVRVYAIRDHSPVHYDEMFAFYQEELTRSALNPPGLTAAYVAPVGGIPAANFALLVQAFDRYGERCHSLYVPEGRDEAVPMNLGERMRTALLRRLALEAVEALDFRRVAALLAEHPTPAARPLRAVADYAHRRLDQDYDQAHLAIEEAAAQTTGALRQGVLALRNGLHPLRAEREEALLVEVLHLAEVALATGRHAEFLQRFFRLLEGLAQHLVRRHLGVEVADEDGRGEDYERLVRSVQPLQNFFQRHYQRLDVSRPTLPVLVGLLEYLAEGGPGPDGVPAVAEADRQRLREAVGLLTAPGVEGLRRLRNQSTHRFAGVSRERLRRAYGAEPEEALDRAREVVAAVGLTVGASPFRTVQDLLRRAVGELPGG